MVSYSTYSLWQLEYLMIQMKNLTSKGCTICTGANVKVALTFFGIAWIRSICSDL